jgi:curved DNA-binding protein CbpA
VATELDATREQRRVDLYAILQISAAATPEVVQAAYRALARSYHPDVNPSPEAIRQMRQLNAAYSVLSDPARRAQYDARRKRPGRAGGMPASITPITGTPRARAGAATPRRSAATAFAAPAPRSGDPRTARVLFGLVFVLVAIGALFYIVWLVAGILDDEPVRAMIPNSVEIQRVSGRR